MESVAHSTKEGDIRLRDPEGKKRYVRIGRKCCIGSGWQEKIAPSDGHISDEEQLNWEDFKSDGNGME